MKKMLLGAVALALGLGVGGASAYGVGVLRGDAGSLLTPKKVFVPTGAMTAPLVFSDGRLAAYISFEAELEVTGDAAEDVTVQLPVLMNAVNLQTYRKPLARGADGLIPELGLLRKIVADAAKETYGPGVVTRVAITKAVPI